MLKRKLSALLAYNIVDAVAWGVFWTFIYAYLYDIGASFLQISLLDSLAALAYVASRVWGAISDYYGVRRPFIVLGEVLASVPIFMCLLWPEEINFLIGLYALSCVFWSISNVAYLASLTSVRKVGFTLGLGFMVGEFGWSLGCTLMGFIYAYFGFKGTIILPSVLLLVASLIILVVYPKEEVSKGKSLIEYLKPTFTFHFRAYKGFGYLLIHTFISQFALQWCGPLLRTRMYILFGCSKVTLSILFGLTSIISALSSSFVAGKLADKIGGVKLAFIASAMYVFYIPAFALINNQAVCSVLFLIPVWPLMMVGRLTAAAQLSDEKVRGEVMGSMDVFSSFGTFAGFLGGLFADKFGLEFGLVLASPFFLASIIPLVYVIKSRSEDC